MLVGTDVCVQENGVPGVNPLNSKDWDIWKFFSDAKTLVKVMHRKIVFIKVELTGIEISERVHWSRRCYAISFISIWNGFCLGIPRNIQPNDILSTYAFKKN